MPVAETVRHAHLLRLYCTGATAQPVLLVGPHGAGKSTVINDTLQALSDDLLRVTLAAWELTDARTLRAALQAPLEKKSGNRYGPASGKRLVYFVDDLNLQTPPVEGAPLSTLATLRSVLDQGTVYDPQTRDAVVLQQVQVVAALDPHAGLQALPERVVRHFAVLACALPAAPSLVVRPGGTRGHRRSVCGLAFRLFIGAGGW